MSCCLPFTLFTCRFKKNKVVDKCFPHKSNTNVLTKGDKGKKILYLKLEMVAALDFHTCPVPSPLTSPFTHLLLSCMKYFSTLEEKFFLSLLQLIFIFLLFLGMVMYAKKLTAASPHGHVVSCIL